MDPLVLAADIGGSHITTAIIDTKARCILPGSLCRGAVNAQGSVSEIVDSWAIVFKQSLQHAPGVASIGIAMPGPFDYEAGISWITGFHKYESLYGLNVKNLLATALQIDAHYIKIANDARCFLQGELFNGAARGAQEVLGFTLGTGFGSSIAEQGVAMDASYYNFPFLASRAEDYFCSRWFVQRYAELSNGILVTDVKALAAMINEDKIAQQVFAEFGANFSFFLSLLEVPPALVLLGGNIARTFDLFKESLHEGVASYKLPTKIVLASLGEEAPLFGAAGLF